MQITLILSALWLGILTSISPCPLATNIAAISFLSKRIMHPKSVIMLGIVYTAGRMMVYAALGGVLIFSLVSVPAVANFLQKYMSRILGPILILSGLFLLNIIKVSIPSISISQGKQEKIAETGVGGAFVLGVIFALSFCPISAALFFGSLIPLALNNKFGIILPFFYGLGTGLPVVVLTVGIAFGTLSISHWFNKLSRIEFYTRKVTGIIFIIAGIYYIVAFVVPVIVKYRV
ncbi:MAG: aromatic aminobenezylarsenical efflux permease ArsG family transporter [Candidatus Aadella gelida]|nr:aromatic aminobenezylarsenical efflux permease ArsG family transporter [Candidatus Aadella gelida]